MYTVAPLSPSRLPRLALRAAVDGVPAVVDAVGVGAGQGFHVVRQHYDQPHFRTDSNELLRKPVGVPVARPAVEYLVADYRYSD